MREDKQLLAISIKKDIVKALKEEAEELGLTLSAYVRFIITNRKKNK